MSVSLGGRLPDALLDSLSGQDAARRMGHAILIATLDVTGRPHPALLSYGEVLAVGPRRLRLATYADSRTTENLRQRSAITLCLVEAGSAHYVKARARELPGPMPAGLAGFEAEVEDVLEDQARRDLEGDAVILTGVTFRATDPDTKARQWTEVHAALRDGA